MIERERESVRGLERRPAEAPVRGVAGPSCCDTSTVRCDATMEREEAVEERQKGIR